jgi:hypothetical protein
MKLKTNCGECGGTCGQKSSKRKSSGHQIRSHAATSDVTRTVYDGRETLVVPVVMARAGVVMNGSLTIEEELVPESWNGVPVTVSHPDNHGDFMSANTPENLIDWSVGRIFNSHLEDGALKGEAYIDIEKANEIMPGLVRSLEEGDDMDVSTGFFAFDEKKKGTSKGRAYEVISRDIKPDHLALLPAEEGACSWSDGCGVRRNTKGRALMKLKDNVVGAVMTALGLKTNDAKAVKVAAAVGKALKNAAPKKNARSNDDEHGQMVADLISNDSSPFTTKSEEALRMMSTDELKAVRDTYIKASEGEEAPAEEDEEPVVAEGEEEIVTESDDEEPAVNEGDEELEANEEEEEEPAVAKKNAKTITLSANALKSLIANEVRKASKAGLTANDRAALDRAHRFVQDDRKALINTITANSVIPKKKLESMTTDTLSVIANGLPKTPSNYGGLNVNFGDEDDAIAKDMEAGVNGTSAHFAARANARRSGGAKKGAH